MTYDEPVPAQPLSLLEGLHSTPSRRYLSSDPIPEDVLWAVLDAAVRGPSGGNRQAWGWVIVTNDAVKRQIAGFYLDAWRSGYGTRRAEALGAAPSDVGLSHTSYLAAEHLAEHLHEAPVWVVPVLRDAADSDNPRLGASIYGAVQQLQLAARAHGLGSTLTTFHTTRETEVARLLGLPDDALTMALIPLGYPYRGNWTQPRRQPVEQVVHWEVWGRNRTR